MAKGSRTMSSAALSPMIGSLYVALGGAVGAVARYQLGRAVALWAGPNAAFPWATLSVNVLGSLAMGLLAGWLARAGVGSCVVSGMGSEPVRLALGVGLLGGFTTFSAFSLEMMALIERGSAGLAMTYACVSVLAGLAALYLGFVMMRGAP